MRQKSQEGLKRTRHKENPKSLRRQNQLYPHSRQRESRQKLPTGHPHSLPPCFFFFLFYY